MISVAGADIMSWLEVVQFSLICIHIDYEAIASFVISFSFNILVCLKKGYVCFR